MDSISSILSNPAVAELIPTALGAIGGAMSSPRLAGSRGAIGAGMLGGAQGLETGIQTGLEAARLKQEATAQEMLAKHYQLQDKIAQGDLDEQNNIIKHFNSLPADQQNQYGGSWKIYSNAMASQAGELIGLKGLQELILTRFQSPQGKAALARQGFTNMSQMPQTVDAAKEMLRASSPMTEAEEAQQSEEKRRTDIEQQRATDEASYQRGELGIHQGEAGTEAARVNIERANEPLVPIADPTSPSGYKYMERAAAVGRAAPAPASTTGLVVTEGPTGPVYTPRSAAAGMAAPPKGTESSETKAAKEAGTLKNIEATYEKDHPKPAMAGIRSGAMAQWQHGLNERYVAAGVDPITHARLSNPTGDSSRADGTIARDRGGAIVGVYGGKVYKLSVSTQ